jgi:hypothetical protein
MTDHPQIGRVAGKCRMIETAFKCPYFGQDLKLQAWNSLGLSALLHEATGIS